jgi:hypothetical protein
MLKLSSETKKMRSYVKLEGNAIKDGVKALENLALTMPEVCIMNSIIESQRPLFNTMTGTLEYFRVSGEEAMEKRCATIVSKSGVKLDGYDFVFEWFTNPNKEQADMLVKKIGEVLTPLGLKYTIKSK